MRLTPAFVHCMTNNNNNNENNICYLSCQVTNKALAVCWHFFIIAQAPRFLQLRHIMLYYSVNRREQESLSGAL